MGFIQHLATTRPEQTGAGFTAIIFMILVLLSFINLFSKLK